MIFLLKNGGRNAEIVTSRLRLLLINVMERDEGGRGCQKHEFGRDVIIECSLYREMLKSPICPAFVKSNLNSCG